MNKRQTDVVDQEQLFRLILSVPSPKAESFKQWMAQVAGERVDEMPDPEHAIDRGYEYYRRMGYSEAWINERMKGEVAATARKELEKQLGQNFITRQNAKALYGSEAQEEIEEQ